ncbi:hypothetical protein BO83DRAFT_381365 [Aspergillus eucalypticola CBS 122712]|uniref:DUF6351 domain-containing protein n=1 Tax=Aspergillus eucalypticola (strain CBS 122712 / IBT 29274) TaxID=1448314 RepID=A0A317UUV4_ASPEC|nr:uncharacterized protein BO83DRAFT_381365 [Aspergillus eucalypticola CBS 122712]PWY65385.1 hypothetical protein BO83DRAFT_381365 [Aspergillus eucalypticola CBS 122712]
MATELNISVISAIHGIVTGNEAVVLVSGTEGNRPILKLNDSNKSDSLQSVDGDTSKWKGVLTGFTVGVNKLIANEAGDEASVAVRGFPIEGPVFSGPHIQPWKCTTEQNGLGPAVDAYCNAPTVTKYYYMDVKASDFLPYDQNSPPKPEQLAYTTTDAGVTVPYIIRHEKGTANRGVWELATLYNPHEPWTAINPQKGWNRKLYIVAFGGWNQKYSQSVLQTGLTPELKYTVFIDMALRRGFMVARSTQMQSNTNSDSIRAAESILMLKQHVMVHYGEILYTFASGPSGASIMQQMIANQYPGLFQGIMPLSSVHSSWYVPGISIESKLLEHYWTKTSPSLWKDAKARLAVDGHQDHDIMEFWNTVFGSEKTGGVDPTQGTGLEPDQTYSPQTNPAGARGTLQDYQVNYLGRRLPSEWSHMEAEIRKGFANLPWDNEGIQYGLNALLNHQISVEQFLDLNEKVGGVDIDANFIPSRTVASLVALERLHRCGLINDFSHLAEIAILDIRCPEREDPIRSHTQFHTWVSRTGLIQAQGHAENQAIWMCPGFRTVQGPPESAFVLMDSWLSSIYKDTSDLSLAEKIRKNRPSNLSDGLWTPDGTSIGDLEDMNTTYATFGDPRTVAACNNPKAMFIAKPQLKPVELADYPGVKFSELELQRLKRIFPNGVADWEKPGIGQTQSIPWLSYESGPGGIPISVDRT